MDFFHSSIWVTIDKEQYILYLDSIFEIYFDNSHLPKVNHKFFEYNHLLFDTMVYSL